MIRFSLRVVELLLVSVTVEMVMSLPMALYFHRITVFALPVNFLIVPFLGLLLPSALFTFATLLVSVRARNRSSRLDGCAASFRHRADSYVRRDARGRHPHSRPVAV